MRKLYPCKHCGSKPPDAHKAGCPITIEQYVDSSKRN